MKPQEKQNYVVKLLTSPWSILVAVAIAVFIGLMFKEVAYAIKPIGLMYLYLLQMTVIPIIIAAIVSSIAGLTRSRGVGKFLVKMISIFILMLAAVAIIGTLGGVIGKPGAGLDEKTRDTLGKIVQTGQDKYAPDLELSLSAPPEKKQEVRLIDFFVNMIPRNIFSSLSSGRALELIIFSIIFGVAIGVVRDQKGEFLISIFDALFQAFQKIITWLMIVLPFGLICLLADQIASTGFEILLAMLKFVFIFYIVGIIVILINIGIIWRRSHEKLGKVLKALLDPIIVALVTRSSFATLPAAIKTLVQKLGFFDRSTNLFFSLGITLGRFGNIIYFAIASIFVAQLYNVDLGVGRYGIIAIGSLFAGIATAGASGISTLNLLAIVLGPLGLPLEAVLIIFMTIDTIADPLRTLLIVTNNMAANALIVPHVSALDRRKGERKFSRVEKRDIFLTRIKEKGEFIVALEQNDIPPFYFTSIDGDLKGISVDIAAALADSIGVKLKIDRQSTSDQELIRRLKDEEIDAALASYNFHRKYANELSYSIPYFSSHQALLIGRDRLKGLRSDEGGLKSSVKQLTGSVSVVAGSVHERTAGKLFPKMRIVEQKSLSDAADAVLQGDTTTAFGNELELKRALRRRPASAANAIPMVFKNMEDSLCLALALQNKAFMEVFNEAIKAVKTTDSPEELIRKY